MLVMLKVKGTYRRIHSDADNSSSHSLTLEESCFSDADEEDYHMIHIQAPETIAKPPASVLYRANDGRLGVRRYKTADPPSTKEPATSILASELRPSGLQGMQ